MKRRVKMTLYEAWCHKCGNETIHMLKGIYLRGGFMCMCTACELIAFFDEKDLKEVKREAL